VAEGLGLLGSVLDSVPGSLSLPGEGLEPEFLVAPKVGAAEERGVCKAQRRDQSWKGALLIPHTPPRL
jgi:hypothetical protein